MSEFVTDVTAISSKGQIVLPKTIRDSLSLMTGARLMVICDGENILLKPIRKPDISEFRSMMDAAKDWAVDVGMKEDDINEAIREVRKTKRQRA